MNWELWTTWEWFWAIVAVLVVLFILRNLPDLFRYLRIRSM